MLGLLVRGRTVQDVSDELVIAQGTAKHVSNIYRKLE
ncbi:MAG: LuxR C-terminal-related transcriptional regulator [Slackia sp.]